jgi:FKBP-type peptidyl-prolyl cis-trans isomerase SlpA
MNPNSISRTSTITLYFELSLSNGDIVDSNFDDQPATFNFGDGSLLPEFEKQLLGLTPGEQGEFTVSHTLAFGAHSQDNIHFFPTSKFPDIELKEGVMINFTGPDDNNVTGVVIEIKDNMVTIDFNHPLAGRDIIFKVDIVDVAATNDTILVKSL